MTDQEEQGMRLASSMREPKTMECSCGTKVELYDPLDNECPACGANYNSCGQRVTVSWRSEESGYVDPYDI